MIGGCGLLKPRSPEDRYSKVYSSLTKGDDLPAAIREADDAINLYSKRDPEWAWRFRLLKADILINQGESLEVLSLLQPALPSNLSTGELAMKREMYIALADEHIGSLAEADHAYSKAKSLCPDYACNGAGELARIGGSIATDKSDFVGAQSCFGLSLGLARQSDNKSLELANLMNLGVVAAQRERYDEAVVWFNQAQIMSEATHNGIGEEKGLGNLGWAYSKTGDFDKSLEYSHQAIEKAHSLRMGIDEIEWLNNVESVNLKRGRFDLAEADYHRSLELATKSRNQRQQIDALSGLGFIQLQTGHLQEASTLIEGALNMAKDSDPPAPLLLKGQLLARRGDLAQAQEVFERVAFHAESDSSLRWEAHQDLAESYAQQSQPDKADREYQVALNTVRNARCSVKKEELRLPFFANATRVYNSYIDFLVQQGKTAEALKTADESRALTLAEGLGVEGKKCLASETAFNPQRTARDAKATILFYWLGADHSYLWAVSSRPVEALPAPSGGADRFRRPRLIVRL